MSKNLVRKTKKNCNLPGPGPGRPKGSQNKFTSLKDTFLSVFKRIGGEDELLKWVETSNRNKEVFFNWITKMLPSNIDVEHSGDVSITIVSTIPRSRKKGKKNESK